MSAARRAAAGRPSFVNGPPAAARRPRPLFVCCCRRALSGGRERPHSFKSGVVGSSSAAAATQRPSRRSGGGRAGGRGGGPASWEPPNLSHRHSPCSSCRLDHRALGGLGGGLRLADEGNRDDSQEVACGRRVRGGRGREQGSGGRDQTVGADERSARRRPRRQPTMAWERQEQGCCRAARASACMHGGNRG